MRYIFVVILYFFVFVTSAYAVNAAPISKKVLILNFNPTIESQGNKKLTEVKNWNDPLVLQQQYIDTVKEVSHNSVFYTIVETQTIDDYPVKPSGYHFTDAEYLACVTTNTCNAEIINYQQLLAQYHVCERVNAGEIDELWLWGGPWFGYLEAVMAGPGAFYTNGNPVTGTTCQRKLTVMGFNYERHVQEMIHDLGHRTEGVMTNIFGYYPYNSGSVNLENPWSRYWAYNQVAPSQSGCGNVHFPPNGMFDYDNTNMTPVKSYCDAWGDTYPLMNGRYNAAMTCTSWGCTTLGFMKWWLFHIPHAEGITNGVLNNWWAYIVDYDNAKSIQYVSPTFATVSAGTQDFDVSCQTYTTRNEIYFGVDPACNPPVPHKAVFTFTPVNIPKDMTVSQSYLSFVSDGPYSNNLKLAISLEYNGQKTSSIIWDITESWTAFNRKQTPDISPLLQEIIRDSGWNPGGTITLTITYLEGAGQRRIFAYERNQSLANPILVTYFNKASQITPTSTSIPKRGDANGDNKVDGIDYVIWLNHYSQSVSGPTSGDFNNSGKVDGVDYVIWLNNYLK